MLTFFVYAIVAIILIGTLYWVAKQLLPAELMKWASILLVVVGAIVVCVLLINLLTSDPGSTLRLPRFH